MVSSINAGSLNLSQSQIGRYNTNVASSQKDDEEETEKVSSSMVTKKIKEAEAASNDDSVTETSEQGDTATFSKEGMQMAQGGASVPSETVASTETSSSTELSSCSDSQLKDKLKSGEISQAEYDKEIERRKQVESSVADTATQELQVENEMVSQINTLI
ncbi:MAG: hypothetical protein ACERKN_00325 [Velocimicrobium sp.]